MSKTINGETINVIDRVKPFVDDAIASGPAVISTEFIRATAEFEFNVDPKLNDRDTRKRVIRAIAVPFILGKQSSDSAAFFPAFYHIKQVKRTGPDRAVAQVEYAFANLSLNGTSCVTAFSQDEVVAALDRQLRDG